MNHITAVLVEDEKTGMDNLTRKLQRNCPNVKILAQCPSGEKAIQAIHELQPQLIFLDVQLGTMTGFDVLERLQHISFEVIFITSYDKYAIQAIKANALDYLLKPIIEKELAQAVNKAWNKIQNNIDTLIVRIAVPVMNGLKFIPVNDILYCEADNNCTFIHRKDIKPMLVTRTLKNISQKLPPSDFFRISRKAIVQLQYVVSYSRMDGGYVTMTNGTKLGVSRNRRDDFLNILPDS